MKSAVLHKAGDLRIEEVDVPKIGPNDVLIKMRCVGICGSDIHYYLEGRIGSFIVDKPLILGHECSGEVAEVGRNVTRVKVGQRIIIEPGFTCGRCSYCRSGRYNLCKDVLFYGTPPVHGAFAEYAYAPETNVYLMPGNMSLEEGAMIEPLAVGMMAAKRGRVSVNDSVAILGAGPIGQMALQAVKAYGVIETYVTDVVDYRLEYAKKAGAKAVVNAAKEDVVGKILELTDNEGVDVVIEASGAVSAVKQTLDIAKRGGRIVQVGWPMTEVPFPIAKIIGNELEVLGVHRYANVYPTAIKAVSTGKVDVKPFITHRFPFEKITEAFETQIKKTGNPMKIIVKI
ncbi:NAD(P)-dependent alcohol dehydrogenase [Candidatus Bathyarchaeota archaeon]|nr:NAD(P)-dependent alcohol dehydrogenase [Candidatus Bathyarchaeota archaeon]